MIFTFFKSSLGANSAGDPHQLSAPHLNAIRFNASPSNHAQGALHAQKRRIFAALIALTAGAMALTIVTPSVAQDAQPQTSETADQATGASADSSDTEQLADQTSSDATNDENASQSDDAADGETGADASTTEENQQPLSGDEEAAEGDTNGEMAEGEADPETADTTEDSAIAEQAAPRDWGRLQPLAELIEAGGPIIVILAALSIISLAITGVKLVQFFILRPGDYNFVRKVTEMLSDGQTNEALAQVEKRRSVIARVMEAAIRGKKMHVNDDRLREEVERVARMKLDGLEAGLPFLSLIATISPLLGLLGTVLGMIEAFQQLETAGDRVDPAILSGGIWEALLTTAAGLSVAIPAAAFYTWLQRTVDVAGQHMEDAATRVFTADIYSPRANSNGLKAEEQNDATDV